MMCNDTSRYLYYASRGDIACGWFEEEEWFFRDHVVQLFDMVNVVASNRYNLPQVYNLLILVNGTFMLTFFPVLANDAAAMSDCAHESDSTVLELGITSISRNFKLKGPLHIIRSKIAVGIYFVMVPTISMTPLLR